MPVTGAYSVKIKRAVDADPYSDGPREKGCLGECDNVRMMPILYRKLKKIKSIKATEKKNTHLIFFTIIGNSCDR